jgi:hypothetical protein
VADGGAVGAAAAPSDLAELQRATDRRPAWLAELVQPEVGGGRTTADQLRGLEEFPGATALRVSGLDQPTFERLIARHGHRFSALHFWKCPRIEDLSPLEDLPHLELAAFYWNQRARRLWNLARNPALRGLQFRDFTRLHALDDLAAGSALTEIVFGDAVWNTSVFHTLDPLAGLSGLRSLRFTAKKINDGRIQPLGQLVGLAQLNIPTNLFTTEQIAWLRARLGDGVEAPALAPFVRLEKPLELNGKARDLLLVGKRKPFLNSKSDSARVNRHIAEFDRLVAQFRGHPALEPA